jgi:hypothetical protein
MGIIGDGVDALLASKQLNPLQTPCKERACTHKWRIEYRPRLCHTRLRTLGWRNRCRACGKVARSKLQPNHRVFDHHGIEVHSLRNPL